MFFKFVSWLFCFAASQLLFQNFFPGQGINGYNIQESNPSFWWWSCSSFNNNDKPQHDWHQPDQYCPIMSSGSLHHQIWFSQTWFYCWQFLHRGQSCQKYNFEKELFHIDLSFFILSNLTNPSLLLKVRSFFNHSNCICVNSDIGQCQRGWNQSWHFERWSWSLFESTKIQHDRTHQSGLCWFR